MSRPLLPYRPDIDGLRAVAVLAVILFHAFPDTLRNGFFGVDVFFVISGFLIGGIVFQELQQGSFRLTSFYARRIRRIFPALLVVLATALVAGWFLLLPDEYAQLGKHVGAGAAFVQNYALRGEIGYFDTAAKLKPMLHLWSLSIEEQYYLLYPPLIWLAWRLGLNFFALTIVLFASSLALDLAWTKPHPERAFYFPQSRFWELWAGALLAYVNLYHRPGITRCLGKVFFTPAACARSAAGGKEHREAVLDNLAAVVGSALILAGMLVIRENYSFLEKWTLLPVSGAVLLIWAGPRAWINRHILSNRLAIFVGLISYPLYLWHWFLLSFARILEDNDVDPVGVRALCVLASFPLAWLTWRFIERPMRFGPRSSSRIAALAGLMVLIGGAGVFVWRQDGFDFRLADEKAVRMSRAVGEWEYPQGMTPVHIDNKLWYWALPSGKSAATLFIGDSNCQQYYPRVAELVRTHPNETNSVFYKAMGACFPAPGMRYEKNRDWCDNVPEDALTIARSMPNIEVVVVAAQWNSYFTHIKGQEYGSEGYRETLRSLSDYLKAYVAAGKKVYFILNIPVGREFNPKYLMRRRLADPADESYFSVPRAALDEKYAMIQADLTRLARDAGATIFDPMEILCPHEQCRTMLEDGDPLYKDSIHLRPSYVRGQMTFIDETVRY